MPARSSPETVRTLERLLEDYEPEVEHSSLTRNSKRTFLLHASQFVRWTKDDFEPGATLIKRKR